MRQHIDTSKPSPPAPTHPARPPTRAPTPSPPQIVNFLTGGNGSRLLAGGLDPRGAAELLPYLPSVALEVVPELSARLASRVSARLLRELFL